MEPDRTASFSRLELDRGHCRTNYRYFRDRLDPSTRLMVLVKANAYGHGGSEFAALMEEAGADFLAVAHPAEGIELRQSGIRLPILVLTTGTDSFPDIIRHRLEPGIPNLAALQALCRVLEAQGITGYPIHIKLDTGMHRLGFMAEEVDPLADRLTASPAVRIASVYSHLAAADDPAEDAFTRSQADRFRRAADRLSDRLGYRPLRHLLNSAGIERFPEYQFDMVRLGIGIYGISALPGIRLAPVASLKCKILQVKELTRAEETIGYGRHGHAAETGTTIATIPAGYADGIDRRLGRGNAAFSVNGHRVPTIGNICMDMCMLDVTGVDVRVGDTATIFGEDPTVTELADILGTIPYEIMTSVSPRIRRVIVG